MSSAGPALTVRRWAVPGGEVVLASTSAAAGDFAVDQDPSELAARRAEVCDRPWTWLRQVHGRDVVTVTAPGAGAGARADAAVTVEPGCPVAVTTADCAPVVLVAEAGVAVVHAGWRGAADGVVDTAAEALRRAGGGRPVAAWVGPCIGPAAYAFGEPERQRLIDRFGPTVAARTARGEPALDLPAVVAEACLAVGWPAPARPACTSDPRWFSHRTRRDRARQTTVAWLQRSVS